MLLVADVYRPPSGRVPTLLLRTPYGRRNLPDMLREVEVDPLLAVRRGFVVMIQDLTLIGTGFLLLALAGRTRAGAWTTTVVLLAALIYYFELSFQYTHDCWIVLGTLDLQRALTGADLNEAGAPTSTSSL